MADETKGFDPTARVKMIGTGKAATHPSGDNFTIHPNVGRKLFDKGIATYQNSSDEKSTENISDPILAGKYKSDASGKKEEKTK